MASQITKEDVVKFIEGMTVLELSELVKELEEKFGVSAAAPVAGPSTVLLKSTACGQKPENSVFVHVRPPLAVRRISPVGGWASSKMKLPKPPQTKPTCVFRKRADVRLSEAT